MWFVVQSVADVLCSRLVSGSFLIGCIKIRGCHYETKIKKYTFLSFGF